MKLEEWKSVFGKDLLPENGVSYNKSFFDERTFDTFFNAFSGFFMVIDYHTLKYVYVSPQFEREMGYSIEQVYEGGVEFMAAITHPDDLEYLTAISAESIELVHKMPLEKRESYRFSTDYRLKHANGQYARMMYQAVDQKLDKKGFLQYSFIMYTNISSHKLNQQLVATLRSVDPDDDAFIWLMPEKGYRQVKPLSDREKQVLRHIYEGTNKQEIAKRLGITSLTLETHRKNIRKKLGARSTAELVKYALISGMV